jgi:L-glyceraldehyde 3-phosphate reductase
MKKYLPSRKRYEGMKYNRCGRSGVQLPAISLGLWHNFGGVDSFENSRALIRRAFDLGITHFDLANNYGPPPGSAEKTFGKILKQDLAGYRDELIISSKAGYDMWPGPYGDWGSRKYLIASLDQSLKRMGIEYVDIFYHHRPDPNTPLEETMQALDQIVRSGKALYAGISNYPADLTGRAASILRSLGTPCLIHQPKYNMFVRWVEEGLLTVLKNEGIGSIVFSPLAQGMLTDRYLHGIPKNSRAGKPHGFLRPKDITEEKLAVIRRLNDMAQKREQTLAQMSLAWVLRHAETTSALIGASRIAQIDDAVGTLGNLSSSRVQKTHNGRSWVHDRLLFIGENPKRSPVMSSMRMPVLFIGHGSPMNIIADNSYTQSLRALAPTLPRPDAILVISAHWLTEGTFVCSAERPEQIYDFSRKNSTASGIARPEHLPSLNQYLTGSIRRCSERTIIGASITHPGRSSSIFFPKPTFRYLK